MRSDRTTGKHETFDESVASLVAPVRTTSVPSKVTGKRQSAWEQKAVAMVMARSGASKESAIRALEASGGNVNRAVMQLTGTTQETFAGKPRKSITPSVQTPKTTLKQVHNDDENDLEAYSLHFPSSQMSNEKLPTVTEILKSGQDEWEKKLADIQEYRSENRAPTREEKRLEKRERERLSSDLTSRSPASESFYQMVLKASTKESTGKSINLLVMGNLCGVLRKGVSIKQAAQATRQGCGLEAAELVRKAGLRWKNLNELEGGTGAMGAIWLVEGAIDALSPVPGLSHVFSVPAGKVTNKLIAKGVKKQCDELNKKSGVQVLCFDGECFTVQGARLADLESIPILFLQTYPLSDSSIIEHAVARQGSWLDCRARALHEDLEESGKMTPQVFSLRRLQNGMVNTLGVKKLNPKVAIKLMCVSRLAGLFEVTALAGDIFWVETRGIEHCDRVVN